jgi:hypothetical protein
MPSVDRFRGAVDRLVYARTGSGHQQLEGSQGRVRALLLGKGNGVGKYDQRREVTDDEGPRIGWLCTATDGVYSADCCTGLKGPVRIETLMILRSINRRRVAPG